MQRHTKNFSVFLSNALAKKTAKDFFVCPCYSRRIHYPTLEKSGSKNITAPENEGKPCKLSDH